MHLTFYHSHTHNYSTYVVGLGFEGPHIPLLIGLRIWDLGLVFLLINLIKSNFYSKGPLNRNVAFMVVVSCMYLLFWHIFVGLPMQSIHPSKKMNLNKKPSWNKRCFYWYLIAYHLKYYSWRYLANWKGFRYSSSTRCSGTSTWWNSKYTNKMWQ